MSSPRSKRQEIFSSATTSASRWVPEEKTFRTWPMTPNGSLMTLFEGERASRKVCS